MTNETTQQTKEETLEELLSKASAEAETGSQAGYWGYEGGPCLKYFEAAEKIAQELGLDIGQRIHDITHIVYVKAREKALEIARECADKGDVSQIERTWLPRARYYAGERTSNIPLDDNEIKSIMEAGHRNGIDFYLTNAREDLENAKYSAFEPRECDGRYGYFMRQAKQCAEALGLDITDKFKSIWEIRSEKQKNQVLEEARKLAEAGNAEKLDDSLRYLDRESKYIGLTQEQIYQLKVELDKICYQKTNDSPSRMTIRRLEEDIARQEYWSNCNPEEKSSNFYDQNLYRRFKSEAPECIQQSKQRIAEIKQQYGIVEQTQEQK